MERRDRWGVAFVGCFILGLVVLSVTAAAVRFPNGDYDMQAMWTIAAAGFAAWVVSTATPRDRMVSSPSPGGPRTEGAVTRVGSRSPTECLFPSEATLSRPSRNRQEGPERVTHVLGIPRRPRGFPSRGESIVTRTRFRRCPSQSRPSRLARVFNPWRPGVRTQDRGAAPARRVKSSPTRTCARYQAGGLTHGLGHPSSAGAEPGRSHALPTTVLVPARTRAAEAPVQVNVKVSRAAVDVHRDMSGRVPERPDIASAPVPPRGPRWRWVVIGSIIGIGSIVWIAGFIAYATHDHPGGFIGDRGFIDAADAVCRKARASLPPPAALDATQEERARAVEAGHAWMTALVDELAVIPVQEADRDEVRWWIARWRALLAVGPKYAEALRTGDPEIFVPIGNLGDQPARDINTFATNNGIDACVV
jgi:hypothetical protein